ncbi:hypothetical protein [Colwellia sp. BRX8-9]|uniref:hypothetical protein n=1 Tax=Colwellia sp. BRX8-9 TaxID=2759831 RepID=UPI0015F4B70D|nr:hypothetical protein [Colwellia sp. BRX8-9]MBA6346689.1 hypothetical protein [Colwellia sp. BRX8-9]
MRNKIAVMIISVLIIKIINTNTGVFISSTSQFSLLPLIQQTKAFNSGIYQIDDRSTIDFIAKRKNPYKNRKNKYTKRCPNKKSSCVHLSTKKSNRQQGNKTA